MSRFSRPRPLLIASAVVGSLFISFFTISYANNPPKSRTGAPNESNCTACHSGTALTKGTEYSNLKLTTNMTDGEYIPDSTYTITISYTESGKSKFGFQTTVLTTSDDSPAGDLVVTSSSTTSKGTATVSSKTRQYIYQKSSGTSGSGKISWSFDWDAPSTNVGSVKFYVALNSSNSNSATSGDKIIVKSFEIDPSSKLPDASFTMSKTTVCTGDTVVLDGTGSDNSTQYAWTVNSGTPKNSKDSVVKAVWSKAGTYTVKLVTSNGIGKSNDLKKTIKVLGSPSNAVTQTGNDTICDGDTVILKADNGAKWSWTGGATTQEINVLKSGTYQVEIEGTNGCKSTSKDFTIEVIPPVSMSLVNLGNDTLCGADSFQLLATSGLVEYRLFNNQIPLAVSSKNIIKGVLPPGKHKLTAIGTDKFGCISKESQVFQIDVVEQKPKPNVVCGKVTEESIEVNWILDPEVPIYEVSLDTGKTWTTTTSPTSHKVAGLNFSTERSFLLRGKTSSPCFYTEIAETTCKTSSCFKVSFDASNTDVCLSDAGNLELNNLNLEKFGIAYNGKTYGTDTVFKFNPIDLGVGSHVINISFIDSNALTCPAADTNVTIKVNPLPVVKILTQWTQGAGKNRICEVATPKVLKGNSKDVNGPEDYISMEWSGKGVTETGGVYRFDPSSVDVGSQSLIYNVTNIYGCKGSADELVYVDGEKKASFTFTTDKSDVSFTQIIANAAKWTWSFGDGNTSSDANPTHTYAKDGTYSVELKTDDPGNACEDVSATEEVSVVGGFIREFEQNIDIYPMPFTHSLNLTLTIEAGSGTVRVYDLTGSMVFEMNDFSGTETLDLSSLNAGMHLLHVSTPQTVLTRTILKK